MDDEEYFTYHYEGNKHMDLQDLLEDCINFKNHLPQIRQKFGDENVHVKRLCKFYGTDPISEFDSMTRRQFLKYAILNMRNKPILNEKIKEVHNMHKKEPASTETDNKNQEQE